MQEVTVLVPEERIPSFYQMFGQWLDATEPVHNNEPLVTPWEAQDLDEAKFVWGKLTAVARKIFDELSTDPGGEMFTTALAEKVGLRNKWEVAGALSWPKIWARDVGKEAAIRFRPSGDGGSYYRIEPDVAQLFSEARRLWTETDHGS